MRYRYPLPHYFNRHVVFVFAILLSTVLAGNLAAQSVTYNYTGGLQYFTVPSGVTQVTIDAYGAQGGDSYWHPGGYGARIVGTVSVSAGQQLKIMVGGKGGVGYCGGGGGGTFVTTTANSPLVIAGGGGGAGYYGYTSGYASGTTSTTGNPGWYGYGYTTSAGGGAGPNGGGAIYYYAPIPFRTEAIFLLNFGFQTSYKNI